MDIAGTGDHRSELEQVVARHQLERAVVFHGFVSEERKIDLMRAAWANVFPSPKEGWGITVIEAAACGPLSLASASPGLRDSVNHGETGFLVAHGDVAALAARMIEVADSRPLVARLGDSTRRFAEQLTWESAAAATERHLGDIVNGSAAG
jgi:glycosyltransferase involved in cell wall biosynthesis